MTPSSHNNTVGSWVMMPLEAGTKELWWHVHSCVRQNGLCSLQGITNAQTGCCLNIGSCQDLGGRFVANKCLFSRPT